MQKKELLPGDSTVVELIFSTHSSKGPVSKSAAITTNDTTQAKLSISFAANIYGPPDSTSALVLTPNPITIAKGQKKQVVVVENRGQSKITLTTVGSTLDDMKAKIKDKVVKPGKKGKIEFAWNGNVPDQSIKHTATFQLAGAKTTRISIPYTIQGNEPLPPPPQPAVKPTQALPPAATMPSTTQMPPKPVQPTEVKPQQQPWSQQWTKPDSQALAQPKQVPKEEPKTKP